MRKHAMLPAIAVMLAASPLFAAGSMKLFVEAESFQFDTGSWQVKDAIKGFATFIPSGLKALSGAAGGGGAATKDLSIAHAGDYKVWVRYGQVQVSKPVGRGPFKVAIAQDGVERFSKTFDEKPAPEGRYWPMPVWESGDATLEVGPARITIAKVGANAVDGRARQVDCLVVTDDPKYIPNHRDFVTNRTWMRCRLVSSEPHKVYFYMFADHMREPWYENMRVSKDGLADSVWARKEAYLAGGESSPWADLTNKLYDDSDTNFRIFATVNYRNPDASTSHYALDFATAANDAAIVKTVERNGKGSGIAVRIPPDMAEGRRPKADYEYAAETKAFTAGLPKISFGKRPTLFPLMFGLGLDENSNSPQAFVDELASVRYLGLSGLDGPLSETLVKNGILFGSAGCFQWYLGTNPKNGAPSYKRPKLDQMEASAKKAGEELSKNPHAARHFYSMLMDEAAASDLPTLAADDVDQQAFKDYVRSLGLAPADLGVANENAIEIATAPKDNPRLYYWSQRYRAHTVASFFRLQTEFVRKYFPANVKATQNYSDGAVYLGNMYLQGNDYYEWFRGAGVAQASRLPADKMSAPHGALDLAWSEDWSNGASTFQCCGWNVALLRSATKYLKQPIGMYVITSYGRTPADVKMKALSDISQGAKSLYFFSYSPSACGHEPGWYDNHRMFPMIAELTREVGAVEDLLLPAMPRKAEVAIVYSVASDIWGVGHGNYVYGMERMHTYLALRHAQIPVDIVSEDDVIAGGLKGYRAAYLFGPNMKLEAATKIVEWTRAGGHLVVTANAATRDEYDQPMKVLEPILGVTRAPAEELAVLQNSGYYIPIVLKPQDTVSVGAATFDVLGTRQKVTATDAARVVATFKDGTPAVTVSQCGKGSVTSVGFLPALSYMRRAMEARGQDGNARGTSITIPLPKCVRDAALGRDPIPMKEYSYNPWEYDAAQREFIVAPARIASRPVFCDRPLVEATYMESPAGVVIPLANYGLIPISKLAVTIAVKQTPTAVFSSRQGKLTYTRRGNLITLSLPLETTDFVGLRYGR